LWLDDAAGFVSALNLNMAVFYSKHFSLLLLQKEAS
jgi:hypothetical protein